MALRPAQPSALLHFPERSPRATTLLLITSRLHSTRPPTHHGTARARPCVTNTMTTTTRKPRRRGNTLSGHVLNSRTWRRHQTRNHKNAPTLPNHPQTLRPRRTGLRHARVLRVQRKAVRQVRQRVSCLRALSMANKQTPTLPLPPSRRFANVSFTLRTLSRRLKCPKTRISLSPDNWIVPNSATSTSRPAPFRLRYQPAQSPSQSRALYHSERYRT